MRGALVYRYLSERLLVIWYSSCCIARLKIMAALVGSDYYDILHEMFCHVRTGLSITTIATTSLYAYAEECRQ